MKLFFHNRSGFVDHKPMKNSEITEESFQSYVETETASSHHPLRPPDLKLSQLIRDHYDRERELHERSLAVDLKEKPIKAKHYIYSAHYDPLTGLINPRFMTLLLEKSLQLAKERDKILAILYIELNGLNELKNNYGAAIADEVLMNVANRLKLAVRKKDNVSHLHGNEYLVGLMVDKKGIQIVDSILEKLIKVMSKPLNINGHIVVVNMRICSVAYPIHGDKISVLLDIAKMKMYRLNKKAS